MFHIFSSYMRLFHVHVLIFTFVTVLVQCDTAPFPNEPWTYFLHNILWWCAKLCNYFSQLRVINCKLAVDAQYNLPFLSAKTKKKKRERKKERKTPKRIITTPGIWRKFIFWSPYCFACKICLCSLLQSLRNQMKISLKVVESTSKLYPVKISTSCNVE